MPRGRPSPEYQAQTRRTAPHPGISLNGPRKGGPPDRDWNRCNRGSDGCPPERDGPPPTFNLPYLSGRKTPTPETPRDSPVSTPTPHAAPSPMCNAPPPSHGPSGPTGVPSPSSTKMRNKHVPHHPPREEAQSDPHQRNIAPRHKDAETVRQAGRGLRTTLTTWRGEARPQPPRQVHGGPLPRVQDAMPSSVLDHIDIDLLKEWEAQPGEGKLIAVPFDTKAKTPEE
ncbi:hypothetical protein EDB84DRAFT_1573077 [Lactarius hengduanensis]|nr:hypothetical protein EDB84DRAFT_1573077 [Lactarius hengduanensis]